MNGLLSLILKLVSVFYKKNFREKDVALKNIQTKINCFIFKLFKQICLENKRILIHVIQHFIKYFEIVFFYLLSYPTPWIVLNLLFKTIGK